MQRHTKTDAFKGFRLTKGPSVSESVPGICRTDTMWFLLWFLTSEMISNILGVEDEVVLVTVGLVPVRFLFL